MGGVTDIFGNKNKIGMLLDALQQVLEVGLRWPGSKAGLEGFSRALAREVGSRSITVNSVAPGFIDTNMTRELPEAQREAIFVEFQRGDAGAGDKAGIGLGLSIVRRFADLLGHDIRLRSRAGKGSVFSVTVPRTFDPVAIPVREQASVDYRYGGMEGAKILLIENDLSSA